MKPSLTPDNIMQLGFGFAGSKILLTAIELGVFSELAKGPLEAATLQARLQLHPRSARDFFDTLVALKLLDRQEGLYSNLPETDLFLDRAKATYMGGILEMANARLYKFWGSLGEALRTGELQNEAKTGEDVFEKLYGDPDRLKGFLQAMTGISLGAAQAIAQRFPWAKYKTFVDVGCAQGAVPVEVARAHAHLSGIGYDLAPVGPVFEEYVKTNGLTQRVKFNCGNFFREPLPNADVIVMGHILHDWNLEEKKRLLSKAYDALPKGGAIIVYEALIDDERRENAFGLIMSLNMLLETRGGFDYTGADCQGWMCEAGFSQARVEHLVGHDSMVVGIK